MKKLYKIISFFLCMSFACTFYEAHAQQTFTLDQCYQWANENYPLIKQTDLIAQSENYTLSNLTKSIWPQLMLNGQLTYQSDVTKIAISIPGIKINTPDKDQYKIYADISQPITELFTIKNQKQLAQNAADVQKYNVEVELFKIKDRINQLYFGILLVDEQLKLNVLVNNDLESGKDRISAAIQNGVDYKSSLDKLKAELIKNHQRAIELTSQRKAFAEMLSYFINKEINEQTKLITPVAINESNANHRPELKLFDTKFSSFSIQEKMIQNKNLPKLSLFMQAGAGKPSPLNMISTSFKPYYIGGVKVTWSLMNLYTRKNEMSLIHIDRQTNDIQKELFLFNTKLITKQETQEMVRLNELLQTDDELVALRNSVKNTSKVQLENGVITTNDFIKEVNAEDQARQQKLLHQIQLINAQYNLQTTLGN